MKKLLKVQKKIGTLSKNAKNPFFKSQYLDLNTLLNEVKPLLEEEGIILVQPIKGSVVSTMLIDSDTGELILESSINIPVNITDPQKLGSCITYFRRYTLKSLLAIAEEDDDGNKASKKPAEKIALTQMGFEYLISDKAKKEDIEKALAQRACTDEQIKKLKEVLK